MITGIVAVNGRRAAGQRVCVSIRLDENATGGEDTWTDQQGHYVFERMRPGEVTLCVQWEGEFASLEPDYRKAELVSGLTTQVDFVY